MLRRASPRRHRTLESKLQQEGLKGAPHGFSLEEEQVGVHKESLALGTFCSISEPWPCTSVS